MDAIRGPDAEKVVSLDEDEPYTLLVPASDLHAYSRGGLIVRGNAIFKARVAEVRSIVCRQYHQRGANLKNAIDLTVLIGTALLAAPAMAGVPALPMAALLVKIGLEELCRDEPIGEPTTAVDGGPTDDDRSSRSPGPP